MSDISNIHLDRLHGQLGDLVYEMTRIQFLHFGPPKTWSPAMNIYHCENCISVCADLAGVDKDEVDLHIEPRRLVLRGRRRAPEPERTAGKTVLVLAMEIDYGRFEREVLLPVDVDIGRVTAEQKNGLLWICLPLRAAA